MYKLKVFEGSPKSIEMKVNAFFYDHDDISIISVNYTELDEGGTYMLMYKE
ncbi:hypothetical protein [Enterococcus sp. DIV0187]|uniref:hypothetical protein n=1 Tax=Enterococcus sp. DIV0187 TaxID=2774644 RepID=UPI003F22D074